MMTLSDTFALDSFFRAVTLTLSYIFLLYKILLVSIYSAPRSLSSVVAPTLLLCLLLFVMPKSLFLSSILLLVASDVSNFLLVRRVKISPSYIIFPSSLSRVKLFSPCIICPLRRINTSQMCRSRRHHQTNALSSEINFLFSRVDDSYFLVSLFSLYTRDSFSQINLFRLRVCRGQQNSSVCQQSSNQYWLRTYIRKTTEMHHLPSIFEYIFSAYLLLQIGRTPRRNSFAIDPFSLMQCEPCLEAPSRTEK